MECVQKRTKHRIHEVSNTAQNMNFGGKLTKVMKVHQPIICRDEFNAFLKIQTDGGREEILVMIL